MMDITKMIVDANMQALYVLGPGGTMLSKVQELERKLIKYAAEHPDAMDVVGEAGLRDEYNQLYMDIITGGVGEISAGDVIKRMDGMQNQYDNSAVQKKIMVEISTILDALVFGWNDAKEKIREGHIYMEKYAQAMVVIRKQARKFHDFIYEDMGISIEKIESIVYNGMDSMRCVLFEEILSTRSIEDVLLT